MEYEIREKIMKIKCTYSEQEIILDPLRVSVIYSVEKQRDNNNFEYWLVRIGCEGHLVNLSFISKSEAELTLLKILDASTLSED